MCDVEAFRQAQSTGQISVMEELCNQSISFKEDLEQLEMELKTSLSKHLEDSTEELSTRNAEVLHSSYG